MAEWFASWEYSLQNKLADQMIKNYWTRWSQNISASNIGLLATVKSLYFSQPRPVIIVKYCTALKSLILVSAAVFCHRKNYLWCFLKTVVLVLGVVPNIFWFPSLNIFFHFFLSTESMSWENVVMDQYDDSIPRARAGHCSVAVSLKKMLLLCLFYLVNGL